jgi:hypothetical protein
MPQPAVGQRRIVKLITGCDAADHVIKTCFHLHASDKNHSIFTLNINGYVSATLDRITEWFKSGGRVQWLAQVVSIALSSNNNKKRIIVKSKAQFRKGFVIYFKS